MKQRKLVIVLAVALAAMAWVTATGSAAFGAESDAMGVGLQPDSESLSNPFLGATDRLLDRAYANVDRLPPDMQEKILALRGSSDAIRQAWESEYRPSDGADPEEIAAARERFQREQGEKIAANRELRMEVVAHLRSELRDRFEDDEWSVEARSKFDQYNELKQKLNRDWREARAALGPRATREEVAQARTRFLEANADVVAQQQALAQEIRSLGRENAQANWPDASRGRLPPALEDLKSEMHIARKELQERRREAREELLELAPQDRELRRREILEELQEAHNDLKDRRRQLIEDIRDQNGGDRRPED